MVMCARVAPLCRTTLVTASCTIRYAAVPTDAGTAARSPVTLDGGGDAGVRGAIGQLVQRLEPGHRGTRCQLALRAEHADEGPQLGESLLAGVLDGLQGRLDLFWLAVHEVQGDAGLHVDEGHVVGHDVMQLAGDAQAFLAGLAAALFGPGPSVLDHPGAIEPHELAGRQHQEGPGDHSGEETP